MSKDLTTTNAPAAPPVVIRPLERNDLYPSPEIAALTALLANGLSHGPSKRIEDDVMDRLPTVVEKRRLHNRLRDLTAVLRPAEMAQAEMGTIGQAVGMMLGGWRNLKEGNPKEIIAGYTMVLKELPVWAVVRACGDFARGEAFEVVDGVEKKLSPDWAPSVARVYSVARAYMTEQIAEHNLINRLISCKRIAVAVDPEARKRVGEMLHDFSAKMGAKVQRERDADRVRSAAAAQEARDRAAAIRDEADRPILALYRSLGLQPVRSQVGRLVHPDHLSPQERLPAEYTDDDLEREE